MCAHTHNCQKLSSDVHTHTIEIRIYKSTEPIFITYVYTPFTLNTRLIKKQLS